VVPAAIVAGVIVKNKIFLIIFTLVCFFALASCGVSSMLPSLGGSGTNVAANTQVGKENRQSAVSFEEKTTTNAGRDVITTEVLDPVNTGAVEDFSISNQNIPPWVMLLLILGWLLPSPTEIWRGFLQAIRVIRGKE